MKIEKTTIKAQPFGAHFTTKLEAVNNKLVCALSAGTTCADDFGVPDPPPCGGSTGHYCPVTAPLTS